MSDSSEVIIDVPEDDAFERAIGQEAQDLSFTAEQTSRARELLARFAGARRSATFYPPGHVVMRDNIDALMKAIGQYHHEGVDVPLVFFDNEVLLGEQLLAHESVIFDQLIRDMSASGETSVTFLQGITPDELERSMQVLAADSGRIDELGGLEAAIAKANIPHVQIGTVAFAREREDFLGEAEIDARASYTHAVDAVREFGRRVHRGRTLTADHPREAVRSIVDNILENKQAMLELSGLKGYDEYTFFHSVNVSILSIALGSQISTNRRFLNSLGVGALMHDIGKMTIDVEVLNKPGALTADEWDMMRLHPLHGAETAANMRGLDRASVVVILEHHMRYDLDGYPGRRPPRAQHLTSRIVALADAYDAMTSRRSYAPARTQEEAMSILAEGAGTAFDPSLVRMFAKMMGVYPPRSVVRLTSGEVGIVTKPNADILAPWVRVITDPDGTFIDPVDIDLADAGAADGRKIEICLDPATLDLDVTDYLMTSEA